MRNTKLSIAFFVAGMPFNGDTLKTKSLGGSETAGLCLAREMAARGHRVFVFSNGEPGLYDGVQYHPIDSWQQFASMVPHDVSIIQRAPGAFAAPLASKLNILWQHDLASARDADSFKSVLWNVDKVALLSDYHIQQYQEAIGFDEELVFHTRNGIDIDLFPEDNHDRKTLIYCSRPERGLDRLLRDIFPRVLEKEPEARLKIAGYDNKAPHYAEFYAYCDELAAALGDRVVKLGALSKKQLYREYASAGAYVYPTPSDICPGFKEISCITVMECMAAGLPFVGNPVGALPETLAKNAGYLVDTDDEMVESILTLMTDNKAFNHASKAGRRAAASLGWDAVAADWESMILSEIATRNFDSERLGRYFMKHSNVMPAKKLLEGSQSFLGQYVAEFRAPDYSQPKEYNAENYEAAIGDIRFNTVHQMMQGRVKGDLLDWACGQGIYAIELSKRLGVHVVGVDLNPRAIEDADKFQAQHQGDVEFTNELDTSRKYGGVFLGEFLEHCEKPWEILETANDLTDEYVFLTVPYGPWELGTEVREHLWEFEPQDFYDMLDGKELDVNMIPCGRHPNGEPIGHIYVSFKADDQPVKQIDMDRKLEIQRPTQTVGASLIAGPGCESTLIWCLESIANHVDQIVIGDTGMSDLAKGIAQGFHAQLVEAPNPKVEGFEMARNATLPHMDTDWVLWIDTDERLIDGENLRKYLRENCYNGYGIRQHHFAIDTQFTPDMPVRLFRNRPYKGDEMKFYGAIHEHPELGLNQGPGPIVILHDVHIAHVGYLAESGRKGRFWRNYPLLELSEQRYPDRVLQYHFRCRDNILLCGYELEQNGGILTDTIRERCNEVIDLYRTHFLGKSGYLNIDTIRYYSQACEILGLGFDADISIQASRDGAKELSPNKIRFASKEDFEKEVKWIAEQAIEPYIKDHW